MTEAERKLWRALYGGQIDGLKFRRQRGIDSYVVDFSCPAALLVIELDGGQHADRTEQDALRTRALEKHGYTVIRFWNHEVMQNLDGVLEEIQRVARALTTSPWPSPPAEEREPTAILCQPANALTYSGSSGRRRPRGWSRRCSGSGP